MKAYLLPYFTFYGFISHNIKKGFGHRSLNTFIQVLLLLKIYFRKFRVNLVAVLFVLISKIRPWVNFRIFKFKRTPIFKPEVLGEERSLNLAFRWLSLASRTRSNYSPTMRLFIEMVLSLHSSSVANNMRRDLHLRTFEYKKNLRRPRSTAGSIAFNKVLLRNKLARYRLKNPDDTPDLKTRFDDILPRFYRLHRYDLVRPEMGGIWRRQFRFIRSARYWCNKFNKRRIQSRQYRRFMGFRKSSRLLKRSKKMIVWANMNSNVLVIRKALRMRMHIRKSRILKLRRTQIFLSSRYRSVYKNKIYNPLTIIPKFGRSRRLWWGRLQLKCDRMKAKLAKKHAWQHKNRMKQFIIANDISIPSKIKNIWQKKRVMKNIHVSSKG